MIASVTPKVAGCSGVSGVGLHTTPTPLHTIGYAVATLASIHNIEASRLPQLPKKEETLSDFLYGSGGRTRTSGLRVMSPTSYQLLYPAMYR